LSEAKVEYADLYDTTEVRNVTKKSSGSKNSNKTTTTRTYLKQSISKDDSAFYYVGTDITYRDLRLKNRVGTVLLNGRQLLDMAKKGMTDYRKAMAFTSDKWNLKKREPIESGTTVADVIQYVRRRMYLNKKGIDAEEEDDAIAEVEIMKEMNENDSNKKVNENDESKNNSDEDDEDVEKGNADNNVGDDDDDDIEDDDYDDDDDDDDDSNNSTYVPDDYIFHSFFVYCMWGPFAEENKQLPLLIFDDAPKATVKSQAQSRSAKRKQKESERRTDDKQQIIIFSQSNAFIDIMIAR